MKKKIEFPYEVKRGSVSVKIYKALSHGSDSFTLSYYRDGVRKRPTFSTFERALNEAEHIAGIMASSTANVLTLTAADGSSYQRARQILDPLDVAIEVAAAQFADAQKRLKNVPLIEVVDYYLKRHPAQASPRTVIAVVEEMLKAKKSDGLSEGYLRHLRYDLDKFTGAFHCNIGMVVGTEVDAWLRKLEVGPRTRNNLRTAIQTLFAFAKAQKYLPKDHDEIDSISIAKDGGGEIEIFTPVELMEILTHANQQLISFLTLGAFAGVRHAEIQRLEWKDINFESGIIQVGANKAKTASRRIIPLLTNLRGWLEVHQEPDAPVCMYRNVAHEINRLVQNINTARKKSKTQKLFAWKHNALRHSFISYRVAQTQNVAQVALEAGNSPQMIFKHYRELVTPKDAEAWFAVMPPKITENA